MHRVDPNDLAHALRLGLDPVAWAPCPRSEDGAINPQVTRFALVDGRWADVTHVKLVYYETPEGSWRPLSEVCSHHGNRQIAIRPDRVSWVHPRYLLWLMKRQRLLGNELTFWAPGYAGVQPRHLEFAATLTAYPDPNPETTTVDGYIRGGGGGDSWATAHWATSNTNANDTATTMTLGVYNSADSTFFIYRAFCLFSTTALGSAATITNAVFSLKPTTVYNLDNDGDDLFAAVSTTPSSNTAITGADYTQCGDAETNPTLGSGTVDISTLSAGTYFDLTLNATGQGWVSKTGVTKLGVRERHDYGNSPPVTDTYNISDVSSADAAGTSSDPKLVVTYTPPPAGLLGDPLRAFQHMIMR
jgi:hypothetical protein